MGVHGLPARPACNLSRRRQWTCALRSLNRRSSCWANSSLPSPGAGAPRWGTRLLPIRGRGVGLGLLDGEVSPCIADAQLPGHRRTLYRISCYSLGNADREAVREIWKRGRVCPIPALVDVCLRPCTACGGCTLAQSNEEDCYGNPFPCAGIACGPKARSRCPVRQGSCLVQKGQTKIALSDRPGTSHMGLDCGGGLGYTQADDERTGGPVVNPKLLPLVSAALNNEVRAA